MVGVLHGDDSASLHRRVLQEAVLDFDRKHLGAVVTDNHALFAAYHEDVALLVYITHVARVQPLAAVGMGLDKLSGGFFVFVVTEEFHFRMYAYFIIEGLDFKALQGFSKKTLFVLFRAMLWSTRDAPCGLSHAIAFCHNIMIVPLLQIVIDAFFEGGVQNVAGNKDGFKIREVLNDVFVVVDKVPIRGNRKDMLGLVLDEEL